MQNRFDVVIDPYGNVVPGVSITVNTSSGALATIYSDNGVTPTANPLTSDALGEYSFYAANGSYSLVFTSPSFAGQTIAGIVLFDPRDLLIALNDYYRSSDGADYGPAINRASLALAGTGHSIWLPDTSYPILTPATIDRTLLWSKGSTLNVSGIGASANALTVLASSAQFRAGTSGVSIVLVGGSQDAIAVVGGSAAANNCDFPLFEHGLISGAGRYSMSFQPNGSDRWIQNPEIRGMKLFNSGGAGIALVCTAQTNAFINQGLVINSDIRLAGQTIAGSYDIFCDSQGSTAAQKISEWQITNCDFDAAGAPNHAQGSIFFGRTGSASSYAGWKIDCTTFEDTGSTITGNPDVIQVGAGASVVGLTKVGGVTAKYGRIIDPTKVTGSLIVADGTAGRSLVTVDGLVTGAGLIPGQTAIASTSVLDWYEEGTWTPTVTLGGAAVGLTYTTQDGTFTRVGNRVFFTCVLVLSALGSSTGALLVNGLPYASAQANGVSLDVWGQNLAAGVTSLQALMSGTTSLRVDKLVSGSSTQLANTDLSNTTVFRLTGHYKA